MTTRVLDLETASVFAKSLREDGKYLVLVTGVFDLLHEEHVEFLRRARRLGDALIIAIESDKRVTQLKGPDRPINSQKKRLNNLADLQLADVVTTLPEDFTRPEHHRALLKKLHPNFLAVSSHTPHIEGKKRLMEEIGGELKIVHEHNPAVSSTIILEKSLEGKTK